jgi:hypothetical protein
LVTRTHNWSRLDELPRLLKLPVRRRGSYDCMMQNANGRCDCKLALLSPQQWLRFFTAARAEPELVLTARLAALCSMRVW